jgi:hypothetical protein
MKRTGVLSLLAIAGISLGLARGGSVFGGHRPDLDNVPYLD